MMAQLIDIVAINIYMGQTVWDLAVESLEIHQNPHHKDQLGRKMEKF
jgi:hypothetical protein